MSRQVRYVDVGFEFGKFAFDFTGLNEDMVIYLIIMISCLVFLGLACLPHYTIKSK